MIHSDGHGNSTEAHAMNNAELHEEFSRLTDRFTLPLSPNVGPNESPNGSGSLSARGGLSTSNSASPRESLEHSTSANRERVCVLNNEWDRAHSDHPVPEARGSSASDKQSQRRPLHEAAPQREVRVSPHAATPGDHEMKAVFMFTNYVGPSPSHAAAKAPEEPPSEARRHRHTRPASAPSAPREAGPAGPTSRPGLLPSDSHSRGGLYGLAADDVIKGRGNTHDLPQRPSRPLARRPSLNAARSASTASSRTSTPRSGSRSGTRPPRQRPASAQPAFSHLNEMPAATTDAVRSDGAPREVRHPGRVYVRRLVRPHVLRAGVPESPYYTTGGLNGPTSPSQTQRSEGVPPPMRANLTRPALIARRSLYSTTHAHNGATAPNAAPSANTSSPRRHDGAPGEDSHPAAASSLSPPPPLSALAHQPGQYARSDLTVEALTAADLTLTPEESEAMHGGHPHTKQGPRLSGPSNGMSFARLGEFTPSAPARARRRSSGRRLSGSYSLSHGLPQPTATGPAMLHRSASPHDTPSLAGSSRNEPFAATGSVPHSGSSSPDSIPSPSALCQRLRERGNECFRRGAYAEAIVKYSEGLELQPSNELVACNRAAAYLMSFRYAAALVDCKWVLLHAPKNLSAHWRAAKSFLYTNRLAEARRFYRTARQISEEDYAGVGCGGAGLRRDSVGSRGGSLGSVHVTGGHSGNVKWLKDRRSIATEEAALPDVEAFWQYMRESDWPAAINAATRLMTVFGPDGPTSALWRARALEASVHVDPRDAMEKVRALRVLYPDCLDLLFVESKALFYCAHDDQSTRQSLALLGELRARAAVMNEELARNVERLAKHVYRDDPDSAAAQTGRGGGGPSPDRDVANWAQLYQWKEDSRLVQLQRCIELFAKYRDDGNAAYLRSDWTAAHNAYTRCLQVDPDNRSLMSTIYCNRSAVAMQSARWKDALADAHMAIELNPLHVKAVSRRARIYLHLFQQQEERLLHSSSPHAGGRDWVRTTREAMLRYLDAAVQDFKTASSLAPQDMKLQQDLNEAVQCRHGFAQQQQQQQQQQSRPYSAYPRAASGHGERGPSAATGHSHARNRRGPQFFTGDDFDEQRYHYSQSQQRGRYAGGQNGANQNGSQNAAAESRATILRYIEVLGLPMSAYASGKVEQRALTKAYRDAALRWHPDKWVSGTSQEKDLAELRFKEVTVAYTTLKECSA